MSESLKLADKSHNMEALRNARSYNDIVVVLSRIRTAVSSMQSRMTKRLSKITKVDLNIDTGEIELDRKALKDVHAELTQLELSAYEIKFARSITHIIPSDAKLEKLNILLLKIDSALVKAKNSVYKYLDEIGRRVEPDQLKSLTDTTTSLLRRMLPDVRITSFIMPDDSDRTSLIRYVVLHGVRTKSGYVLSEFLVAIHAQNNFDDTYSYLVSFPVRPRDKVDVHPIKRNELDDLLRDRLSDSFNVRKVKSISDKSRRSIETMDNIRSVSVVDGTIQLNLESGVTGKDINTLLHKALPVVHATFGVTDPRVDVLHRVGVDSDGAKIITFLVSDRNFYDRKSLSRLRKLLDMSPKVYKDLTQLLDK